MHKGAAVGVVAAGLRLVAAACRSRGAFPSGAQTLSCARNRSARMPYPHLPHTFDEFYAADGSVREHAAPVVDALGRLGSGALARRGRLADAAFVQGGVTFSVYSDPLGVEKIFPFDLVPRPIPARDWERLALGIAQRVVALNAFLHDAYGPQRIVADRALPAEVIAECVGYEPLVRDITPPKGTYIHVAGIDLIRDAEGTFRVLEDNLRCPSGVSYVLENRAVMKRALPEAFSRCRVQSVETYPVRLRDAMDAMSPSGRGRAVILTPGPYNSAYFEHGFLARRTGCGLVQGSDLHVEDERVYVKTTHGLDPVGVIYRRIDDAFLDPTYFRPDSLLGVPGLMSAYAAGNVTLMNAVGNGVADDKGTYPYVPDLIRYYLDEDPILAQVETLRCREPAQHQHVRERLDEYVVKRVDGAGGYGMLIGPTATKAEREAFRTALDLAPHSYIAQPLVELSSCPIWDGERLVPRRVDLRPYVITTGDEPWVLPGGLTRVALAEGSYVVNSSQGGGSKDTWVLSEPIGSGGGRA